MVRRLVGPDLLRSAARLAARVETPFYLFEPRALARRVRLWRDCARRARVELFYPYKCNRHAAVLERFAADGIGAEVASVPDIRAARSVGLEGDRIIVQGPAKPDRLIEGALACGAMCVADGREDVLAIAERALALGKAPRYLIRLACPSAEPSQRPFGLPAGGVVELARQLRRRRMPPPEGLAFHLGTGLSSLSPYLRAIQSCAAVARELRRLGIEVRVVDVGGGFAATGEARFDLRGRARAAPPPARQLLETLGRETRARIGERVRVLAEPGRALVSDSFHLVARVLRVKNRGRGADVFLDGSRMSHAFFVPRGAHPLGLVPLRPVRAIRLRLRGPLGVGLDLFERDARLATPLAGDLVVIGSVGAYNLIAANSWSGAAAVVSDRPQVERGASRRRTD